MKVQINFRHKVLCQLHQDNSVFKFSQNRRQHSVDRLKQNLVKLLSGTHEEDSPIATSHCPEDISLQPENLVGLRIQHRFEVDDELLWFKGTVLEMNPLTKEFKVIYDGEDDPCWFALLEDINSGDLMIIESD